MIITRDYKAKTLTLTAMCFGFVMVSLDTTVVNVALPQIQQNLNVHLSGLQWVVNSYTLTLASLLLSGGALGDRLGLKRVFLAGLLVFTGASALCGVALNLWMLIAARFMQGVGAALLLPTSLSLLCYTFPEPKERAKVIGIWTSIAAAAVAAGPVIGGFFVHTLGWRSAFLVNLPVGILGFGITTRFVSESIRSKSQGLDLAGQVVGISALCSLTFALIEGSERGWISMPILSALVIFILASAIFITIEYFAINPMLPLGLFAKPTFSASILVGLLLYFGFYGQIFFLSLFFQQVLGYSALMTGAAFLPLTGVTAVTALFAGRFTGRLGPRRPIATGLALCGAGSFAMMSVNATTSYVTIFWMLVIIGFGAGSASPSVTAAVLESLPQERTAIASAIFNTSRQIGGVLGVAVLGSLLSIDSSFVNGMHWALITVGSAMFVSCIITLLYID